MVDRCMICSCPFIWGGTGRTSSEAKKTVGVGLSEGDNYTTMAKRIQKELIGPDGSGGSYYKAVRIARTEAHRVREEGNLDAAQNLTEKLEPAGMTMVKTWHTMKDERVRPNRARKTKGGWKYSKGGKYDHQKMEGVQVPVNEEFTLPSGAKTQVPGKSGVAGEDINCRCFLSYDVAEITIRRMAAENSNDWSETKTRVISESDKKDLNLHAEQRNVHLGELSQFDGETELLLMQIDTLSELQMKYPLRRKITLGIKMLDDEDFGQKKNRTLCVNTKALRSSSITEQNIKKGARFASKTVKDIVIHEYGHFIEEQHGRINLDIVSQALYNINEPLSSEEDVVQYLVTHISKYSIHQEETAKGRKFFSDIGSEVLVCNLKSEL